jgi:hypothetical protein
MWRPRKSNPSAIFTIRVLDGDEGSIDVLPPGEEA